MKVEIKQGVTYSTGRVAFWWCPETNQPVIVFKAIDDPNFHEEVTLGSFEVEIMVPFLQSFLDQNEEDVDRTIEKVIFKEAEAK